MIQNQCKISGHSQIKFFCKKHDCGAQNRFACIECINKIHPGHEFVETPKLI